MPSSSSKISYSEGAKLPGNAPAWAVATSERLRMRREREEEESSSSSSVGGRSRRRRRYSFLGRNLLTTGSRGYCFTAAALRARGAMVEEISVFF